MLKTSSPARNQCHSNVSYTQGHFLSSSSSSFCFSNRLIGPEVPIIASRKQWTHDRAQLACHIPKIGWHDSMKKTRTLDARPPGWMARGAKVSLSQRKYPCGRIATLLLQSTKSPVLGMNIQSLQIDLVQRQTHSKRRTIMGRQSPSANPAVCKEAEQCWLATYA